MNFPRPIALLVVVLAGCGCGAAAIEVASPDGRIVVGIDVSESGQPRYQVAFDGHPVIQPSRLGLLFARAWPLESGLALTETGRDSRRQRWEQPWGERRLVLDHSNELRLRFSGSAPERHFDLQVRVFNDGLGFRYLVPQQQGRDGLGIVDELTEFHLHGDATAWWQPGRRVERYEYLYRETSLDPIHLAHTPMTLRLASGTHLSLHEAALVDYAGYVLDQRRPGVFKTSLAPASDGIAVRRQAPFHTPWRTIQISSSAAGLLDSSLILNLNEPSRLGDVSWFKPGKYVGMWWAMHTGRRTWASGPRHGATTAAARELIDFAAEYGFNGVLMEGWNQGWGGEPFSYTQAYEDFDLPGVAAYAAERGVGLIGHHETFGDVARYEAQMAGAFDLYQSLGVRQVKTGYVADAGTVRRLDADGVPRFEWHDGQFMVNHYLRTVQAAAARGIAINTHEPVKDTGLRRTWPNWVTREGARGQEFNAFGNPPNPPSHTAILPFTRLLAGPMDFTPGIFDLTFDGADSPQRVSTTLAKQLALYVVLYSPVQMAADLPENYKARPRAFEFIRLVPTDWEQSVTLAAEVGQFVAVARQRRGGEDWYLGALTNEAPRRLDLPLRFLAPDMRYAARIYRDGDDAHWQSRPDTLAVDERQVGRGDVLHLQLAAGGGAAVSFQPVDQP